MCMLNVCQIQLNLLWRFDFLLSIYYFLVIASSPPVFDKRPSENVVNVKFQDAFNLECSSRPPIVYPSVWDWKKDGKPLSATGILSKRISSKSGTLIVRSAVAEDSGNYTCTLVNSAGSVVSEPAVVVVKGQYLINVMF